MQEIGPSLLLVEDDERLVRMLERILGEEGYRVTAVHDGQSGLHLGLVRRFDVLLIDRGLPGIEGVNLLERLRGQGITTPVLLLTARGSLADRVEGLDAGAEDYLVKPFEIDELLARLRALLRRHSDDADVLIVGPARLDIQARRVLFADRPAVDLSARECALLHVLARHPNRVYSRDELLHQVFDDAERPGAVDTYVHYLRRKLGRPAIKTVHGLGYRLGSL
ncbi:MAG TPA: response regulator transcription factor [Mycobacteriales bacterium]|nr:response regulator transcription factor [Mycobacteriales bacterium]